METYCTCGNTLERKNTPIAGKCDECMLSYVTVYTFATGEYPLKEHLGFTDVQSLLSFWVRYPNEVNILANMIYRNRKRH